MTAPEQPQAPQARRRRRDAAAEERCRGDAAGRRWASRTRRSTGWRTARPGGPGPAHRARARCPATTRAPRSPGRKRAVLVVGGAGVARADRGRTLYAQAQQHGRRRGRPRPPPSSRPAISPTAPRPPWPRTASTRRWTWRTWPWSADARFADAHFVVATVPAGAQPSRRQPRDEFRKYLELAPLGRHAAGSAHARSPRCRHDRGQRAGTSTPASLADLRARYVEGGRPLPAAIEAALAADRAPGRAGDPGRGRPPAARQPRRGAAAAHDAALRDRALAERRRARRRRRRGGHEPAGRPGRGGRGHLRAAARASLRSTTPSASTPRSASGWRP